MKKIILIPLLIFCNYSIAQTNSASVNEIDASNFLEAYFSPLTKSLESGLTSGWYNTGKPHKLGGFDITATINTISVPNEQLTFDPNSIPNFNSNSSATSTIIGSGNSTDIQYQGNTFSMPSQTSSINKMYIPMMNASIGLAKKTDFGFRYIPEYTNKFGNSFKGSISLWGASIKHDLLQWIPFGNSVPADLSFHIGHTSLKTNFDVNISDVKQVVDLNIRSTSLSLIASKKFLMITAYGSLGYNTSSTIFNSTTSFQVGTGSNTLDFNVPLDIDFAKNNYLKGNLGIRAKLAFFTLHFERTFANYPISTLGIGFSFR
ncbi:MAG: hypothetical protein CMP51_04410 [Flavobacteriales bacterium]|nr:hypothetical protein [Flavobacteriales bacterium]|tara:strand:+ start:683 stop:1636 length:954 start_codon:yes stop_codon:yes gene_type:complete